MNLNNIPENVLKYLLDRHLRINRMQYYLYNVKYIIVLSKYWWIIPMYITTKTQDKTGPDHTNGKPKHTIDELFDLFIEFRKEQNERWQKQEEFNKQQLDFNKSIMNRLDNIVKKNNLKE